MQKFKIHIMLLLIGCAWLPQVFASTRPEARGVWMSREVIQAGPAQMEQVFYELARASFNRVLINVHYKGATIYPSAVVARVGGPLQSPEFQGRDPLQEAIEIGQRWGLEVIAWFEYGLMVHHSTGDTSNAGPILKSQPDWQARKRNGSAFSENQYGIFFWLEPAHPQVVDFMADLFGEIAEKYPNLDGIETDRIRYPSDEFSYSEIARSRYQAETGGSDPIQLSSGQPEWQKWQEWRERQTTTIARRIYQRAKSANPALLISAAVAPPYMFHNHEKLQRWDAWADSGYVDALEPMLYVSDADLPNQLSESRKLMPANLAFYPGIGYANDLSLANQIQMCRTAAAQGLTIWYYGAMTESTLKLLASDLFSEPANLPHNDIIVDNSAHALLFQKQGDWRSLAGGYNNSVLIANSGAGSAIATWIPKIAKSGRYEIYARWPADPANASDARYQIRIGEKILETTVDQRQDGDRWVFLAADSISYQWPVRIQLDNRANGQVVADAVRLVFGQRLGLFDLNVPDSLHLELKFSAALEKSAAETISHYAISGNVAVVAAQPSESDPSLVYLTSTAMTANQAYTLTITGLKAVNGATLAFYQTEFQYQPLVSELFIDNRDPNFRLFGNWRISSAGDQITGTDFLISEPGVGENRAQWWGVIEKNGYYEIAARWPQTNQILAKQAPYSILHQFAVDTMRIDQNEQAGLWNVLGSFYYPAGKVASVMVSNAVSTGMVAADAVRIRRTLSPTAVRTGAASDLPTVFRLEQNYPNPFNPTTRIAFELFETAQVDLSVYNVLGIKVTCLVHQVLAPGGYHFDFNGSFLPAGIYFSRLSVLPHRGNSPETMMVRKMLLIN